jgi:hypothetical protein
MTDKADDMKIAKVTLREMKEIIKSSTSDDLPVFMHGMAGLGKTTIFYQLCQELRCKGIKFDAHLKDPTDLKGYLFAVQENGKHIAKYIPPDDLPQLERDGEFGIIFFDEILFAVPAMQNALHGFLQENRIGDYHLPPKWLKLAASNREIDQSHLYEMGGPTRNRFRHYQIIPNPYEWIVDWAIPNNINPLVTSYVKLHPDYFCMLPDGHLTFITPRILEQLSKELDKNYPTVKRMVGDNEYVDVDLRKEAVKSCIGEGLATEFFAHCLIGEEALKICEQILRGQIPKKLNFNSSLLWTINMFLVNRYKKEPKKLAPVIAKYILEFDEQHPEFAVLLISLCRSASEEIKKCPDFSKIVNKYIGTLYDIKE